MFDFEKLEVYAKTKALNKKVQRWILFHKGINSTMKNQLRRASVSMVINIAEGTGRFTSKDKRNFYTIARGSAYECVALLDILKDDKLMDEKSFQTFYLDFEIVSKMLLGLIRSQK